MKSKSKTSCWLRGFFFLYIIFVSMFRFPSSKLLPLCLLAEKMMKERKRKKSETFHRAGVKVCRSSVQMMAEPEADPDKNQTQNLRTRPEQRTQWARNGLTSELKYRNYKQPTTCPIWWQHINIYYAGMEIDMGNDQLAYILYTCKKSLCKLIV